jgi:nucleoside-diphosphate kinase
MENKKIEKTLVLIKPDGLLKSLTGDIINSLSESRLKIIGAKIVKVSRELAEKHYERLKKELIEEKGEKRGLEIYDSILEYIQGKFHTDRVFAMVYSGENAIEKVKKLCGKTNPEKAELTSIRGKYGRIHSETKVFENVIHCSDSEKIAKKEIPLWFKKEEIVE